MIADLLTFKRLTTTPTRTRFLFPPWPTLHVHEQDEDKGHAEWTTVAEGLQDGYIAVGDPTATAGYVPGQQRWSTRAKTPAAEDIGDLLNALDGDL